MYAQYSTVLTCRLDLCGGLVALAFKKSLNLALWQSHQEPEDNDWLQCWARPGVRAWRWVSAYCGY
jgi:hypothetical protein